MLKGRDTKFVEELASHVIGQQFPVGMHIIRQGDIGNKMFIIKTGKVDINVHGNVVANLGEGSVFGEMCLLASGDENLCRRNATVTVTSFCDCYTLDRDHFLTTLGSYPPEKEFFLEEARKRLDEIRLKAQGVAAKKDTPEEKEGPAERAATPKSPWRSRKPVLCGGPLPFRIEVGGHVIG